MVLRVLRGNGDDDEMIIPEGGVWNIKRPQKGFRVGYQGTEYKEQRIS